MKHRTFAAVALAGTLALTGCTGGQETTDGQDPAPASSDAPASPEATDTGTTGEEISPEHNDADVMFAQMMIPHHQQAVEMSETLLAKDDIPQDVADFAQGVIDAQQPEIDRMNSMLEAWGQDPVSATERPGRNQGQGQGQGHGGMSGMMSEDDIQRLNEATGTDAARLYLEQMIRHHEGAVEMAEQQVSDGQNPQAIELAEQIIQDQEAEIRDMETMLEGL
ncbi:DUF305 domain-containing protein [Brevibacterium daeguense]|uniref:DUF305 domain-containing protein n=2 Tax=Brevibacterium daeguense TaxID=909936 RepID=A0ABP8EP96_9MICO|nr:DUF305 domain-containing protein [Brevibacterium daeguense]